MRNQDNLWRDDLLARIEPLLGRLIGFDTTSHNSNRDCILFIRDYLDSHGVASQIVASDDGGKACLWATVGEGQSGVALAGHSDVVPVAEQNWTSDPFTLTARGDRLFARGAADMKGFIACALAFVPEFLAARTGGCFHLAFTSDEETDMSGAMRLTDYLIAQNIKPTWWWVGEPTGLTIVDQHKGVAAYSTRITGVPGHSGQPAKGLNAIELAAEFITMIGKVARQKQDKPFSPSRFDPPYTSFNLGKIKGGTAENIIAENCEVLWQIRTHPGDQAKNIIETIEREAGAAFAERFAKFAPHAGMKSCACFDIPPFFPTPDNPGTKTLQKLLRCDETRAVGFATEAGIFQKLGAPAVICGPGFIEQAHQPDEYIDKSQLAACVDLLRGVLLSSSAAKTDR